MSFKCIPSCGRCCGLVGFTQAFMDKHGKEEAPAGTECYKVGELYYFKSKYCPFLKDSDKTCMCYEDRPDPCKEYGRSERLPCPYVKPNGHKRTLAAQKHILREQLKKYGKAEELMELEQ